MTEADRARLAEEWLRNNAAEWDAYFARPLAERKANEAKIEAALVNGGAIAGRRMAAALGMPTPPDELCDPAEVLEARIAEGPNWMRNFLVAAGLSKTEIDDLLQPAPANRMDH